MKNLPKEIKSTEIKISSRPLVISTIAELIQWRRSVTGKVGFVPTMGALHRGHATLLEKLKTRCDVSVLSIFVNPTQFGPMEDLTRYPRTFEKDLETAALAGVDVVFAPSPEEIYPHGYTTYVEETALSLPLCGVFRPGHFRGVTTIVFKLFNLVRPQLALFGLKDAQQFFVLDKMVRDLNLEVQIEGVQTVREVDGLAMSSRNVYLSPENREKAPLIYRCLSNIRDEMGNGASVSESLARAHQQMTEAGFQIQYLECLKLPSFEKRSAGDSKGPCLVAFAGILGTTRLIDNIILHSEELRSQGILVEPHV